MSSNNVLPKSYKADYEMLQLDDRADWNAAQRSYRRLVHLWHPDKFAQRPAEKTHAQQQFINLTKSYNSLRNFHRENSRLPFESAISSNHTANNPPQDGRGFGNWEGKSTDNDSFGWQNPGSRTKSDSPARRSRRTALWATSGALMMLATIAFFLVLDNHASKARMSQGREVVRQAPASDFLPDTKEIRKIQAREAFLKPTK